MALVGLLAAFWGMAIFLGATHGHAVRVHQIKLGKEALSDMRTWLSTNELDTNYLAEFRVEPWTNSYTVNGRSHETVLRLSREFGEQGWLVLTREGEFLFVYRDGSQIPRMIEENYSPPRLQSWRY